MAAAPAVHIIGNMDLALSLVGLLAFAAVALVVAAAGGWLDRG
jgi:hypothetical protein